MSYGDQHDRAVTALTTLIQAIAPTPPAAVPDLLRVREQVRLALIDRVEYLGGRLDRLPRARAWGRWVNPDQFSKNGPDLLRGIIEATPTDPAYRDRPPSSVLTTDPYPPGTTPTVDSTVRVWREAATALILGTHDLTTAADQPWRDQPAAAWHLIADAADLVEAHVVLDDRLAAASLLPRHPPKPPEDRKGWGVLGQRATAASIAREASWEAVDASPDLAHPAPARQGARQLRAVRAIEDLPIAQAHLARLIDTPLTRHDPMFGLIDDEQRISIGAARTIALGQLQLAERFAALAGDAHPQVRDQFLTRATTYQALRSSSSRLRDVQPFPKRAAVVQQSEILQGCRQLQAPPPGSTAGVLAQLNLASHQVAVALGRALRRELLRPDSTIHSPRDPENGPRGTRYSYGPVSANHSITRVYRELTNTQAPVTSNRFITSPRRAQLRAALDQTPTLLPHRPRPINNTRFGRELGK